MKIDKDRVRKLLKIYYSLMNAHYQELVDDDWKSSIGTKSVSIGLGGPSFYRFGKEFNL